MSYLAFEAVTSLSKKEVVENLQNSLTELNWLGKPKDSRAFSGTVSKSDFKIMRVVLGRDSFTPILYSRFFNPIIYGHVWSANQRTHVRVRMTFHILERVSLAVYSVVVVGGLLTAILDNGRSGISALLLLLLLPWSVGIPLFYYNASQSKKLLQAKLELIEVAKNGG